MNPSKHPEFVSLVLDQVRPSGLNPRRTFSPSALDQLAASIAAKGVLEPILVRPRTFWQLVCGFVARQKHRMDTDGTDFGLSVHQFQGAGIDFNQKDFRKSLFKDAINQLITEGRAEPSPGINFSWRPGPKALDPCGSEKDPLGLGIDHYQLVCGERRWRASKLAGIESIPALVRDLGDHEAAEVAVIENDQREDVPPLEQAEGYAQLIKFGDDIESIATKIGRPAKYVAARLTLIDLIEPLKDDLRTGKLPFGHAHLIARLPEAEQRAFCDGDCDRLYERDGTPVSLDELRRQLRSEFIGLLNDALWNLDDEELLPAAGSCIKCSKRCGANPTLFDDLCNAGTIDLEKPVKSKDLNPDHCTDRTCYAAKRTAFIELQIKKTTEKTGAEPLKISNRYSPYTRDGVLGCDRYETISAKEAKTDPAAKQAVFVEGDEAGKVQYVRMKKASTGRANDSYAKEEAERRKKAAAANRACLIANGQVAEKAMRAYSGDSPSVMLSILRRLVMTMAREMWNDAVHVVSKRRELGDKDHRALVENAAHLSDDPAELFGMLAELIAARLSHSWGSSYTGHTMIQSERDFWDAFGIDKEALIKEALKKDIEDKKAKRKVIAK